MDAKPDAGELFALASEQAGYFTAAQAHACGYSWTMLSHHAGTGRFIRLRRGLYRLRDYPSSPHEEMMAAVRISCIPAFAARLGSLHTLGVHDHHAGGWLPSDSW